MKVISLHIVPADEELDHTLDASCWCKPVVDADDKSKCPIYNHNVLFKSSSEEVYLRAQTNKPEPQ